MKKISLLATVYSYNLLYMEIIFIFYPEYKILSYFFYFQCKV